MNRLTEGLMIALIGLVLGIVLVEWVRRNK